MDRDGRTAIKMRQANPNVASRGERMEKKNEEGGEKQQAGRLTKTSLTKEMGQTVPSA